MPAPILAKRAKLDFDDIVRWTTREFGGAQARTYRAIIAAAIAALGDRDDPADSRTRDDLRAGLRTLHLARGGRRARHLLIYTRRDERAVILRILHDSMDIARHLPSNDE